MLSLPRHISFQGFTASIIKCFVLMMMKDEDDGFSLNSLYQHATETFYPFIDKNGMMDTRKHKISEELGKLLGDYETYFDIKAIQHDIHQDLYFSMTLHG